MHQQSIILLVIGLVATCYGLDLSHASKRSTQLEPRVVSVISDLYAQAIYPLLNYIVTNLALLSAQVMASISQTGIPAPGGRTLHPSEEQLRGFFDDLWNSALRPPLENALSGISLLAAQVLAGIGTNGVNLGVGKRDLTEAEMRGFFSGLWNDALKPPLAEALSGVSLLAAQVLAGIGTNGINLGLGKRDLTEAEMRGFLDTVNQAINDVYANVIQKPLENALAGGALLLAQMLAGLGTNGVDLSGLIGKRDLVDLAGREEELRGILANVGSTVFNGVAGVWNNIFQVPLENLVQSGALSAAGWLANLSNNVGKRSAEARGPILTDLAAHATGLYADQVKPLLENALNTAAVHLAGVLANFSQMGIGRR